eukprot:115293-Chlamydomonas_euryale.AAC.1
MPTASPACGATAPPPCTRQQLTVLEQACGPPARPVGLTCGRSHCGPCYSAVHPSLSAWGVS